MVVRKISQCLERLLHGSAPKEFRSTGFVQLPSTRLFEEETLPTPLATYYPTHVGEILRNRYQIIGKLGYGGASTIWMCRDLHRHYYAAKIFSLADSSIEYKERDILKHFDTIRSDNRGFAASLAAEFELKGPKGDTHVCLLKPPLSHSLEDIQKLFTDHRLPDKMLKAAIGQILLGLHFLHSEAHVIHTDLQASNILTSVKDTSIFKEYEQDQIDSPPARKIVGNRTVYESRRLKLSKGLLVINDFETALFGPGPYSGLICPHQYRPPEVILGMKWSYQVDIWNLGCLIWHLYLGEHLFCRRDGIQTTEAQHLAEMVAVLGSPPKEFLEWGGRVTEFFDCEGTWIGEGDIRSARLEDLDTRARGGDKEFIAFLRRMLQWDPDARAMPLDLIYDDWLGLGSLELHSNR